MVSSALMKGLLLVYFAIAVSCFMERNYPKLIYWIGAIILNAGILMMK